MKSVEIDRNKRLKEEPHKGHNRWHPDIPPILEVDPHEEVVLETRDASDGQIKPGMTVANLEHLDTKVAHPLTGPVYIKGPGLATCWKLNTWILLRSPMAGPVTGPALVSCGTCSLTPTWPTGKLKTAGPLHPSSLESVLLMAPSWVPQELLPPALS
jgi:hypothetical protein